MPTIVEGNRASWGIEAILHSTCSLQLPKATPHRCDCVVVPNDAIVSCVSEPLNNSMFFLRIVCRRADLSACTHRQTELYHDLPSEIAAAHSLQAAFLN